MGTIPQEPDSRHPSARGLFEYARDQTERAWKFPIDLHGQVPPAGSFPGYEIIEEIHRGGQGVVYKAEQSSTGKLVALKVMREGPFAGLHDRARFEREVAILAKLNDRHIVAILDSGLASGHSYFVMEYVDGEPLDTYATRISRPTRDLLELFHTVCKAVSTAHLHGVIHRDLKPSNIRVDSSGQPHVLDFGLAKETESDGVGVTLTGQFLGSLPWASPEQAHGDGSKVDLRTDVYALGVILYQLLTGQFPYEVVGNMRDVLDNIIKAEPVRPSTFARVDDELETIALKCLHKDPERRYQSATELARDIERYLAGQPIEAKRDSTWYFVKKLAGRHRSAVVGTCIIALLITGSAVGMSILYAREQDARGRAEESQILAENEAARFAAMDGLINSMLRIARQKPNPRQITFEDILDGTDDYVTKNLEGQPLVEASFRVKVGEAYDGLGIFDKAEHHRRLALNIRERELGTHHPETLKAMDRLGLGMNHADHLAAAEPVFREVLSRLQAAFGDEYQHTVWVRMHLAAVLEKKGAFDEARDLYQDAREAACRGKRNDFAFCKSASNNTILFLDKIQELNLAEKTADELIALCEQEHGNQHRTTLYFRSLRGQIQRKLGHLNEAERAIRAMLEHHVATRDDREPLMQVILLHNLAAVLRDAARFDESESLFRKAIELALENRDANDRHVLMPKASLAELLRRTQRYEEAEELARKVSTAWRSKVGPDKPDALETQALLGRILLDAGKVELADTVLPAAVDGLTALYRDRHEEVLLSLRALAKLRLTQGNEAEARDIYARLDTTLTASRPETYWLLQAVRVDYAKVHLDHGRAGEARPILVQAVAFLSDEVGDAHVETQRALSILADALDSLGEAARAAQLRKRLASTSSP